MSESDFQKILEDVQEISELLDFNVIFIGGVATYLYSEKHNFFSEFSHDADFYMSQYDIYDLEDMYGVASKNTRLNKSELQIRGVDYDIYIENQNKMIVDYQELMENSIIINNIARVPAIEYLILLKYQAFKDRQNSHKGEKDARDLLKLMYFGNKEKQNKYIVEQYFDKEMISSLKSINSVKIIDDITDKNSYQSSIIKKEIDSYIDYLSASVKNEKKISVVRKPTH